MTAVAVEARGLGVAAGENWPLRDVTFALPSGSILGIIGRQGAGKSTLLQVLAGLATADEGEAWLGGTEITADPAAARRLAGYLPEAFGVYEGMTVLDDLSFFAACHGVPRSDRRRLAADLMELVDIAEHAETPAADLSRGLRQRLGLARCLVHDPQVLLLDEPTAGLDPRSRLEVRELLRELQALGKAVVLTSHAVEELADLCTHIGLLGGGMLVSFGTVESFLARVQRSRLVHLRVAGSAEPALAALRTLPYIAAVSADGDGIHAAYIGGPATVPAMLQALVGAGVPVLAFGESRGGLEEAFLVISEGK